MLTLFNFAGLSDLKNTTERPIFSNKGFIYAPVMTADTINEVLNFINSNIDEKASILVLPEGPVINFMSNRKVDLHCFMMVRLYHDALGDETAKRYDCKN